MVFEGIDLLFSSIVIQWRRKRGGHGGRGPPTLYLGGAQYRSAPP